MTGDNDVQLRLDALERALFALHQQNAEIKSKLEAAESTIHDLKAENEILKTQKHALELEVQAQRTENEKLVQKLKEAQLASKKNSTNSSRPPSSDGPGAQARGIRKRKKKPSGRKRGGQKGRKGTRRALLPPEQVHKFVDLFPERCKHCGASLEQVPAQDPHRHQTFELARPGLKITEFRRHRQTCSCCSKQTTAPFPEQWRSGVIFGPRLHAVVCLLSGVYHLSRRSTQSLLKDLFGLDVSVGAISNMEKRLGEALSGPEKEIEAKLSESQVRYTDETSWLCAGQLMSLWVLTATVATLYRIFDDGKRATIRDLVEPDGQAIVVSDRAAVFLFLPMHLRQTCWAHLIRKFKNFAELDGLCGRAGKELLACANLLFHYYHAYKQERLSGSDYLLWMGKLRETFLSILSRTQQQGYEAISGSCANLLKHAPALWTFLDHEDVEPTNNRAERELRPFVLWRKRCFGAQSDRGHRFASRIMSVSMTARKASVRLLDYLTVCVGAWFDGAPIPSLFACSGEST